MIKLILTFFVVYVFFHLGLHAFVALPRSDKWCLTKTVAYSIMCSVLTVAILTTIVILF